MVPSSILLFSLLFCPILGLPVNSFTGRYEFLQFNGHMSEPAVMEAKAYCASRGLLSDQYVTDFKALPPISWSTANVFELPSLAELNARRNRTAVEAAERQSMRRYTNIAVNKNGWEAENGRQIWLTYRSSSSQTAYQLTESGIPVHFVTRNHHAVNWRYYTDSAADMEKIQEWLSLRAKTLQNENHTIYIHALEALFRDHVISKDLYSLKIEDNLKKYGRQMPQEATVVSCAEKPLGDSHTSIVIAMRMKSLKRQE